MKVLIPLEIKDCERDCPFWENSADGERRCNFDFICKIIPAFIEIPDWCPLKKFEVK